MENQEEQNSKEQQAKQPEQSEQPSQKPIQSQNKERIAIFIDGSNFYHDLKRNNFKHVSLKHVVQGLAKGRQIVSIFYYTAALGRTDRRAYYAHRTFFHILSRIPQLRIVYCRLKKTIDKDNKVRFEVKGDDIHLANDLLVGAYENFYDIAILVSGDEDFIPVVKTLKKLHKKVENGYFRKSSSHRLRKICNTSINMRVLILEMEKLRRNQKAPPSG